jgi:hypothetical protein
MKTTQAAVSDGFAGYEDGVEGRERPANAGLIQGLTKYTKDDTWEREDEEIPEDRKLIVAGVKRLVQKWIAARPVETIVLQPGQKFPDVKEMNDREPRENWTDGPDGNPRGPWQAQTVLYLVDPMTMEKYSYPTGTVGGQIAIRELVEKIDTVRRLKGDGIYAVVTLSNTFMKTKFGGRQRPHFIVVEWTRPGGEVAAEVPSLPPSAPAAAEPTFNDSVDELFAGGEKKPAAKANGKRSKAEAA